MGQAEVLASIMGGIVTPVLSAMLAVLPASLNQPATGSYLQAVEDVALCANSNDAATCRVVDYRWRSGWLD